MALPGASYPPSGQHIPASAAKVISCVGQNCISRSLVCFLHDRKILSNMIDDVKDLVELELPPHGEGELGVALGAGALVNGDAREDNVDAEDDVGR